MAKAKKAKAKSNRPNKYEDKIAVTGSFMDLMKASAKDATNNSQKKKP